MQMMLEILEIDGGNTVEKYNRVFVEIFGLKQNFLPENVTRNGIKDWDSIGHISLITKLEDEYDILFDTDDILKFNSYLTGIDILKKYGVKL
jgi:acyl carrier protein